MTKMNWGRSRLGLPKSAAGRIAVVLALLAGPGTLRADVIVPSANLPPVGGSYNGPPGIDSSYDFGAFQVFLSDVSHSAFTNPVSSFAADLSNPGQTDQTVTFQSKVTATATTTLSGFTGPFPVTVTGPVTVEIFNRATNDQTGTFNTQMLSMDLTGLLPGGHSVEIKLDPTRTTTGGTTITPVGGDFQIHSFFDVFTEISLDSGPFVPQSGTAPTHMNLMPEPGGLTLAALGCAALAGWAWRRRRRTAAPEAA
jgi:hypothetical protein